MTLPRLASIDIGTNSAILLIADRGGTPPRIIPIGPHGFVPGADQSVPHPLADRVPLRPVLQKVAAPRVGRNLAATGVISDGSFAALEEALDGFLAEISKAGAALVGAVATEAFRKASNGPALLERVSGKLGIPCRILTGEEEARLGWLAVRDRHPMEDLTVLDIGAGSTEITTRKGGISLPIGAVSLLEACGMGRLDLVEACRERAKAEFRKALSGLDVPRNVVVVGGTATALAMSSLSLKAFDSDAIEGYDSNLDSVNLLIGALEILSSADRALLPGLDPGRAEIILPGLAILAAFLEVSERKWFRVSDRGIRYGIILDAQGKA